MIPLWGYVRAKPSEYLVHSRAGKVLEASSGQGATCFKRPGDSVAVVPTSLQRLVFTADQVTREKIGVEVRGFAVYRIAAPRIAFRVLDFSRPDRAQERLEQTLCAMFAGAVRRIVAALGIEECLARRKASLADELLREIAPVVGGAGRPEDRTESGWGVIIDSIEIQEVRVQSEAVFAALQAPYRAELDRTARRARADAERDVALRETEGRREIDEARVLAARRLADAEEQAAALRVERRAKDALRQVEIDVERARADLSAHEARREALGVARELALAEARGESERRALAIEGERVEGLARAEVALAAARADRDRAEARARVLLAERLPDLAAALGQRVGEVKVTHFGVDGGPFSSLTQALESVVALAKQG